MKRSIQTNLNSHFQVEQWSSEDHCWRLVMRFANDATLEDVQRELKWQIEAADDLQDFRLINVLAWGWSED